MDKGPESGPTENGIATLNRFLKQIQEAELVLVFPVTSPSPASGEFRQIAPREEA